MNKDKRFLLIAVGITVVCALVFAFVMVKMIKENGACVDSPFEYSAQRLEDSGGMYSCYCQSLDPELLGFSFDKNGLYIDEIGEEQRGIIIDFDFTEPDLLNSNQIKVNISTESIEVNLSEE